MKTPRPEKRTALTASNSKKKNSSTASKSPPTASHSTTANRNSAKNNSNTRNPSTKRNSLNPNHRHRHSHPNKSRKNSGTSSAFPKKNAPAAAPKTNPLPRLHRARSLSPGERVRVRASLRITLLSSRTNLQHPAHSSSDHNSPSAIQNLQTSDTPSRASAFPLPGGEGQGEGVQSHSEAPFSSSSADAVLQCASSDPQSKIEDQKSEM